jgi:photosystem II CP47 chlorophyll apoprotein
VFSSLCFSATIWHWAFCDKHKGKPNLDLLNISGIHLFLSGLICFGFGIFHLTDLYCPRIWVSDFYGLTEKIQTVNPAWGVDGFDPFVNEMCTKLI